MLTKQQWTNRVVQDSNCNRIDCTLCPYSVPDESGYFIHKTEEGTRIKRRHCKLTYSKEKSYLSEKDYYDIIYSEAEKNQNLFNNLNILRSLAIEVSA